MSQQFQPQAVPGPVPPPEPYTPPPAGGPGTEAVPENPAAGGGRFR